MESVRFKRCINWPVRLSSLLVPPGSRQGFERQSRIRRVGLNADVGQEMLQHQVLMTLWWEEGKGRKKVVRPEQAGQ